MVKAKVKATLLQAVQGDITREKVDAIVNAANSSLMGGGGVDGAIHRAGGPAIVEECRKIVSEHGRLPAGQAVITIGGKLPAKYVIHTVGPVWRGGNGGEEATLASCYTECLKLATANRIKSVSFPAISTGVYGYPQEPAARTAINSVIKFLNANSTTIEQVRFVLYDTNAYNIYAAEFAKISSV
ncbi:MAG: O-acetyl-ADP-ribose deacetylase [Dehalococcoidia bacterium]